MFFFFNDTATTEIYTLSLHDALPILRLLPRQRAPRRRSARVPRLHPVLDRSQGGRRRGARAREAPPEPEGHDRLGGGDRKSTRLNSSHANISYAVFCLKKKNRRAHV